MMEEKKTQGDERAATKKKNASVMVATVPLSSLAAHLHPSTGLLFCRSSFFHEKRANYGR
uniref:Uncharacterized protein n=1 Tax=Oryza brachyantha TaxID=4533 RepID=J3KW30_ORYBR